VTTQATLVRAQRDAYRRSQRQLRLRSLALAVLIPTAITFIYYAFIARPQYHTQVKFTIQGLQQAAPDLLTGIGIPSISPASNDGRIVMEYVRSTEMVTRLRRSYGFDQAYAGFTLDPWGHISRNAAIESATAFWNGKAVTTFDPMSSVITIDLHAYRPEDSLNLAKGVLAETSRLVNSLNNRVQTEALRLAERELAAKEADYRRARERIAQVRGRQTLTLDAETGQEVSLVGSLEGQIASTRVEQAALSATYRPDSPQMVAINQRLAGLEEQRARAQALVRAGPGEGQAARDVSTQAALLEYDYAQKAYYAALTALQETTSARNGERRYIVAFVPPRLPEKSDYWSRWSNVLGVAIGAALLISLGNLVLSVIRDHTR
jgi:capsular polysaccharide transport system permease protein